MAKASKSAKSTRATTRKPTSATSPMKSKKKGSIIIKKAKSQPTSPTKKTAKAVSSSFVKEIQLFRNQKDYFNWDAKYEKW
jgi:hypothetical protein